LILKVMMIERLLVYGGLAGFLFLVSIPFWFSDQSSKHQPPSLSVSSSKGHCVESRAFMRANHMKLLEKWRDDVVRHGNRIHVSTDGRVFQKSLTHTCIDCHENREEFCGQCHSTLNVKTYCWECHVTPLEVQ